jgi:multiple sugar transport system permease protein
MPWQKLTLLPRAFANTHTNAVSMMKTISFSKSSARRLQLGLPPAWALFAPLALIITGVVGYPFIQTIVLSFTDAKLLSGFSKSHWIGFENYAFALTDTAFLQAMGRTLYFTVLSVGLEACFGVLVALLLNQEFPGRSLCRALLVLPWAIPTIVNALMWRLIYQPDFGGLNAALVQNGFMDNYRSWLGEESSAMNSVIIADVWKNYPIVALIVLAALQNAPRELYEAAKLEGANAWACFKSVTWPVIMAPLLIALVLRAIEALKVFDIIYVMTHGGPADSTRTLSFFVYQESFSFNRVGSGASYALLVVLMAMVFILAYVRMIKSRENA